jgi:hypothetical protein
MMIYILINFPVSYDCGRSTGENGTYFNSPATPQRICTLEVDRNSPNICQVLACGVKIELNL